MTKQENKEKVEEMVIEKKHQETKSKNKVEQKPGEKTSGADLETKTEVEKKEQPKKNISSKKTEVYVRAENIPASTKESSAICDFIRGKDINKAIEELEEVLKFKRAIPMKGEVPHRKGKIMSGRYPVKTVKNFIILLKSLNSNALYNDLHEPVIKIAYANIGQRPYGRFGSVRKKRSHIVIMASSKKNISKKQRRNK